MSAQGFLPDWPFWEDFSPSDVDAWADSGRAPILWPVAALLAFLVEHDATEDLAQLLSLVLEPDVRRAAWVLANGGNERATAAEALAVAVGNHLVLRGEDS